MVPPTERIPFVETRIQQSRFPDIRGGRKRSRTERHHPQEAERREDRAAESGQLTARSSISWMPYDRAWRLAADARKRRPIIVASQNEHLVLTLGTKRRADCRVKEGRYDHYSPVPDASIEAFYQMRCWRSLE